MTTNSSGYGPGDFLVVEDPKKPSTWHLQVKKNGKPDHGLMGAAYAALTSNHRGQPYQGPNKAAALAKLKALYTSEKMDLPSATMADDTESVEEVLNAWLASILGEHVGGTGPEAVSFSADLTEQALTHDGMVVRSGLLFRCGEYPDKDFAFDAEDLQAAVAAFTPVPVDLEHVPTVLEGKLGEVTRVYPGADGKSLMGDVALPAWLDSVLEAGNRKVSATWDRATKTLKGLALVRNPRVSDAALFAAFAAADPSFARKRHNTRRGQSSLQDIHDVAAMHGAVCNPPAQMAARHEANAIQQVHDTAVEHGAHCEALDQTTPAGQTSSGYFSRDTGFSQKQRSMRMKITDWLTGKAQEEGIEIEDLETVFSTDVPTEVAEKLAAVERENAALKQQQEQQAATFTRLAEERRQAEAVAFAERAVSAHRLTPAAAGKLAPLAARIAASDATATFAEGEKSTTALLAEFVDALLDLSVFTTSQIKSDEVVALFSREQTPGIDGKGQPMSDERRRKLRAYTPTGRAVNATESK